MSKVFVPIDPRTQLPAMPPLPLELLFSCPVGTQLVEAAAPRFVGDPACPVCHAALHYQLYGDANSALYRAYCSRSREATRMHVAPKGHRHCRWVGWLVLNPATGLMLIVGHGGIERLDAAFATLVAGWMPPPSLP